MKLRHYDGSLTLAAVGLGLVIFGLLFVAIWAMMSAAFGADVDCLSKDQARARYPKQVIYWHTANRCWDNIPARGHTKMQLQDANGNRLSRSEPRPTAKPVSLPATTVRPAISYPPLMPGRGTDDSMLYPGSVTIWVTIADFDDELPPFIPWERRIYFHTHGE
jgi:hypothetical protein